MGLRETAIGPGLMVGQRVGARETEGSGDKNQGQQEGRGATGHGPDHSKKDTPMGQKANGGRPARERTGRRNSCVRPDRKLPDY